MTFRRGFRILPYRLKRIIQEHYPEFSENDDYLARVKDQILRHFLPTLTSPLYDELLRIKLGILAHGPSHGYYQAVEELVTQSYLLDTGLGRLNMEAVSLAKRLDRHLYPTKPGEHRGRMEADARHHWPDEWSQYVRDSGWLKRSSIDPHAVVSEYLFPHYVPKLLAERNPEYVAFLELRADMYLRGRMAYRILKKTKEMAARLDLLLDSDILAEESRHDYRIVQDKVLGFIDEIRSHLRGPRRPTDQQR